MTTLSAGLGMLPRVGKGASYKPAKKPKEPLTIWGCAYTKLLACALVLLVLRANGDTYLLLGQPDRGCCGAAGMRPAPS